MTDELLAKYLLDEADAGERSRVEQWLEASDDNKRYFEHFRLIWNQSKDLAPAVTISEEDAWQRFQQRIHTPVSTTSAPVPVIRRIAWIRAAAILLLLAVGGIWIFLARQNRTANLLTIHTGENVRTDTLPDGSVATLNKNSLLSYPKKFTGSRRAIRLQGEAFFDVRPEKDKPFIIQVNDITVTVLGTSFNIKSTTGTTEIIVETGMVKVTRSQHELALRSKEKVIVRDNDAELVRQRNTDELYNYYRTKAFICNNTPLQKLVATLNEAYDAHIVIASNELKNLPLTTTFHDEPLEHILDVIRETFNITITRKGELIILQ